MPQSAGRGVACQADAGHPKPMAPSPFRGTREGVRDGAGFEERGDGWGEGARLAVSCIKATLPKTLNMSFDRRKA